MASELRRARREGAIAIEIEALIATFGVPLATPALRVLLADRGRPTTAEHLARVAAGERTEFLRTRLAPRLCAVVAPSGEPVAPRWWADGDWRLQRRIRTEDALPLWRGKLVEGICSDLIARRRPASPELVTLVRSEMTRLGFERLPERQDWQEVRALLLDDYPDVVFADEIATPEQREAEAALLAADRPAVDRYFGIARR